MATYILFCDTTRAPSRAGPVKHPGPSRPKCAVEHSRQQRHQGAHRNVPGSPGPRFKTVFMPTPYVY